MAATHELKAGRQAASRSTTHRAEWLFSWPLLAGMAVYLFFFYRGSLLLQDGDVYWHIATGQWIWRNGAVPMTDPFSHTMAGTAWTAHEWLSDVILAAAHEVGGWNLVVALAAASMAAAIALLTRALLRWLEPIYALLFAVLAEVMTAGHVLARPHILAMPLLMLWTIELVRASEERRSPRLWLLPLMTLWANLHGGFTLGIALAVPFAAEALLAARKEGRLAPAARAWGTFIALAVASALLTPHGLQGLLFTWQVMFENTYALERIGEWQSPNFHTLHPLELWLLGGLALVLHQGLRLPPIRLILLLGLLHLALKHARNIELVGLLGPLLIAAPFAEQWRQRPRGQQLEVGDRLFRKLALPAGRGAILLGVTALLGATVLNSRADRLQLPENVAPVRAIAAVQQAGIQGPVLNSYNSGGFLIYSGIAPFIDGRADVYQNGFMKRYVEALQLMNSDGLEGLLDQYRITWTLLDPDSSAVALLDHLPQWRRLYADKAAVVHVRADAGTRPNGSQTNDLSN